MARPKSAPRAPSSASVVRPTAARTNPVALDVSSAQPNRSVALLLGDACFVLALFLAPLLGGVPGGAAYGSDVFLNLLRVLICISGIASFALRPLPNRDLRLHAVWFVFAWTLLSTLLHSGFLTNQTLLFAMLPATLDWLCFAVAFTIALQIARDSNFGGPYARALFQAIPVVLVAGASVCALSALSGYIMEAQAGRVAARVSGTFFSPNFAAGLFALALPLSLFLAVSAPKPARFAAYTALCAGLVAGIGVTGSRFGAVAAAIGGIITGAIWAWQLRAKLPWQRILLVAAASLVVLFIYGRPLAQRVNSGGGDSATAATATSGNEQSGAFRTWTWRGTFNMAEKNPILGTGPGTFACRYPEYALVGRTDLAHQAYLQILAEQGFPALLGIVVLVVGCVFAIPDASPDSWRRLLFAALIGAVVSSLTRGLTDSEWSLLGNALPFFACLGLLAGTTSLGRDTSSIALSTNVRMIAAAVLLAPLFLAALLLRSTSARDTAISLARERSADAGKAASAAAGHWPADPDSLALVGDYAGAARVEPSGKRFYQLARFQERAGNIDAARDAFLQSTRAEPTSMQSWRAYAEFLEKHGSADDARAAWSQIIELHEGPTGTVRAISEIPEIHPAYAYAKIADLQRAASDTQGARSGYTKSLDQITRYARTPALYRKIEEQRASEGGIALAERRRALAGLYDTVVQSLRDVGGTPPDTAEQRLVREALTASTDSQSSPP